MDDLSSNKMADFSNLSHAMKDENLLIIINIVDRRSKKANQTFSLTWGIASVRTVKGKWIILHLEHGKKKGGVGGRGRDRQGEKRDTWAT